MNVCHDVIQIGRHPRGNIPEDRWKRVKLAFYDCNVYRITFSSVKESLELRDEVSPWGGDLLIAFNNRWDKNQNAAK